MQTAIEILPRTDGPSIAYARSPGAAGLEGTDQRPGLIFLGGFMSDMGSTKATALESFADDKGLPYLRFDYSGHGASQGRFEDGTIGAWLSDTLTMVDQKSDGPQILIGSSMGGWIALLAALARPKRICGIVGIAAAPDFTEDLLDSTLSALQRETLMRDGIVHIETPYGDKPYAFTLALIDDGRDHLLLDGPIAVQCPIRLIQGHADPDVPWKTANAIMARVAATDCAITLIKDGDHRLSRPQDLAMIGAAVTDIIDGPDGPPWIPRMA